VTPFGPRLTTMARVILGLVGALVVGLLRQ
jgi:hypothetical protein